ncbi:MAG: NapC/NirT family cytochrome c [Thermincola sp.]|nr:NapC/NirT family cytochrome c [Thermincola sp.]
MVKQENCYYVSKRTINREISGVIIMSKKSERTGFLEKRSNKLLILIIVVFLALVATTVGAFEYTSASSFCNSCHIMNPSYNAWASSGHKDIHCYNCHLEEGKINYLKAKVNGLKEVYLTVTNSVTTTGTDEKAWDKCQKCHAKVLEPAQKVGSLEFEHAKHLNQGMNCKQCHGNLVHGEENKDFKQFCIGCHQSNAISPSSHSKPEFKATHGQAFLKNNDSCAICHNAGQAQQAKPDVPSKAPSCQACHGVALPHPQGYIAQHKTDASKGTAQCMTCHNGAAGRQAPACSKCHKA